ncbi:MAG: hypothetical protein GYA52_07860 [Chloroflexi bacterium]|nr:hypothetical protein [Chloroflexota bacterium]
MERSLAMLEMTDGEVVDFPAHVEGAQGTVIGTGSGRDRGWERFFSRKAPSE